MFCIGSVFLRIMYARNEVISIDFFFFNTQSIG